MIQKPMFAPQTEWVPPTEFPNLSKYDEIAIDLETKDPDLMKMGSGSVTGNGTESLQGRKLPAIIGNMYICYVIGNGAESLQSR